MGAVKILQIKEVIRNLLETQPHLRDNDEKLIANIWKETINKKYGKTTEMTGYRVLELLALGELPNSESIRRGRCKLQETTPHLRGQKYDKRKNNEDGVKGDLNDFNLG